MRLFSEVTHKYGAGNKRNRVLTGSDSPTGFKRQTLKSGTAKTAVNLDFKNIRKDSHREGRNRNMENSFLKFLINS